MKGVVERTTIVLVAQVPHYLAIASNFTGQVVQTTAIINLLLCHHPLVDQLAVYLTQLDVCDPIDFERGHSLTFCHVFKRVFPVDFKSAF